MADVEPILTDKEFQNWLKCALAILFVRQGLEGFVKTELAMLQKDLLASRLNKEGLQDGTICTSCTTENVLPCPTPNFCSTGKRCSVHNRSNPKKLAQQLCPKKICHNLQVGIRMEHRFDKPSWNNTDATKWCTDVFEIAKCFLPPNGYSAVTSFEQTDFNGILSIILNCKRFQNKMLAQLNQPNNVCMEARDVGRRIRHSSHFTLTDSELKNYIDVLTALLTDTKYLAADTKAQDAANKLNQLISNTLTVTTEDIKTALDANITEQHQNVPAQAASVTGIEETTKVVEKLKSLLQDIEKLLPGKMAVHLDEIKYSALDEIRKEREKAKEELQKEKELLKKEIQEEKEHQRPTKIGYFEKRRLKKSLKEDLINYYKQYHSTIPVSPLVKQYDVPLVDIYVKPTIQSIESSYNIDEFIGPTKRLLESYRDLLFYGKEPYKEIYITAKAGVGKTSFAKRLCMTWCQAHSPDGKAKKYFEESDTEPLKKFDYLFMIALKESDVELCHVDKLVYYMIKTYLPSSKGYNKMFIEKILDEAQVLIVLDGLDEWVHPNGCQRKAEEIPHRVSRSKCTVLTTTRNWKYASAPLKNSQVDMHAEICEFEETATEELVKSATTLLNKFCEKSESAKEIQENISTAGLGSLKRIPYILLQVTCLLHDGFSIGESRSEIYSRVLEVTLERANLKQPKAIKDTTSIKDSLPPCFTATSNELCKSHFKMLLNLGNLALETLVCSTREASLTFGRTKVLNVISEEILEYLLNVGLLVQTKDKKLASSTRNCFSFQDKSFQEFFAALYIQSSSESDELQQCLLNFFDSVESLIRMSNIFIFLGGFNPAVCGKLLRLLQDNVMSRDKMVKRYRGYLSGRTSLPECHRTWEKMKALQAMQLEIIQEIFRSKHSDISLFVEDLVVDGASVTYSEELLTPLIANSKAKIKSLSIEQCRTQEEFTEILEKFDLLNVPSLEKLVISAVPKESDLESLLSRSVDTMKCLDLCYALYRYNKYYTEYTNLLSSTVSKMFVMTQLHSLRLNSVGLTHSDVTKLVSFVTDKTAMKEVGLCHIICSDHKEECPGIPVNLSGHQGLETLRIGTVPISELKVNPEAMTYCYTGSLGTDVHRSLAYTLQQAPFLHTLRLKKLSHEQVHLYMQDTLAHLKQLRNVAIEIAELSDVHFGVPTGIENVHLYEITMPCKVLKQLIADLEILSQQVIINLQSCQIIPEKEYKDFKDRIRSSPQKYKVRRDDENRNFFSFQSRK